MAGSSNYAPGRRPFISTVFLFFMIFQVQPVAAQTIVFPHENVSDLRGVLNVFHAFKSACLKHPVSEGLPAKLVPAGYEIVSRQAHMGWEDHANSDYAAILSKTGLEQEDWDSGNLFIDFLMPTDENPYGRCSVSWKRIWDYEDGLERIALGMHGIMDSQISHNLKAILVSKPRDAFSTNGPYRGVSDWSAQCLDGRFCRFKVNYDFNPNKGIDLSIAREAVLH